MLWPQGIPAGLAAKERNNKIQDWCTGHGRSVPSTRTIQMVMREDEVLGILD